MHKQQVGDQHDETHLRNILAMLGYKPQLAYGNNKAGEDDNGIGIL